MAAVNYGYAGPQQPQSQAAIQPSTETTLLLQKLEEQNQLVMEQIQQGKEQIQLGKEKNQLATERNQLLRQLVAGQVHIHEQLDRQFQWQTPGIAQPGMKVVFGDTTRDSLKPAARVVGSISGPSSSKFRGDQAGDARPPQLRNTMSSSEC